MTPLCKRPDPRPAPGGRAARATTPVPEAEGGAEQRAIRAARRRWRLKALACLRRKAR